MTSVPESSAVATISKPEMPVLNCTLELVASEVPLSFSPVVKEECGRVSGSMLVLRWSVVCTRSDVISGETVTGEEKVPPDKVEERGSGEVTAGKDGREDTAGPSSPGRGLESDIVSEPLLTRAVTSKRGSP